MIRPDRALSVLLGTVRWVRDNAALAFVTLGGAAISLVVGIGKAVGL